MCVGCCVCVGVLCLDTCVAVVMLLMTAMNAVMHWGAANNNLPLVYWGGHAMSLMIVLFISVIGGRVMPMFTANGTMTARVPAIEWLEKAVLGSTWLLLMLFMLRLDEKTPALFFRYPNDG